MIVKSRIVKLWQASYIYSYSVCTSFISCCVTDGDAALIYACNENLVVFDLAKTRSYASSMQYSCVVHVFICDCCLLVSSMWQWVEMCAMQAMLRLWHSFSYFMCFVFLK